MVNLQTDINRLVSQFELGKQVSCQNGSSVNNKENSLRIKLRKLQIRHFVGNIIEWKSFWSIFDSNIHSNDLFTDKGKFAYLLSLLGNEALNLVKCMTPSDENYQRAVNILQEEHGNIKQLKNLYYDKIINMRCSRNEDEFVSKIIEIEYCL
ncbi:hypothetical protein RF11_06201 [Thelohanellus kitauei]|uniref:Uncharacterized protein n=1 Tax=Thelohanellus kitauei TaxID=669202 RepID=A0A0C2M9L1_THEKT|nr:hypothetical protein RF11_06201 [Thelohanellus kitauei]